MPVRSRAVSVRTPLLVLALAVSASAQSGGVVTGVVADETGGVLPGVVVGVETADGQLATVTGAAGDYRVPDVPPGPASVTFRLVNFSTARQAVTLSAGQTLTVDATLTLSLTADVVVTGTRTFPTLPTSRTRPRIWCASQAPPASARSRRSSSKRDRSCGRARCWRRCPA